jgi:hypothetical protein
MTVVARKTHPAAPAPEEIRARLAEAKNKMARLLVDQAAAAEDISPAGDVKYQAVCDAIKAASIEVERFELALAGIERKQADQLKADQVREQAALRARVAKLLDDRIPVARRFEAAVGAAVEALHELASFERSRPDGLAGTAAAGRRRACE